MYAIPREFWAVNYRINESFLDKAEEVLTVVAPQWGSIEGISSYNRARVLRAFQDAGVTESDFAPTTGYGYGDRGREKLEVLFSSVFGTESALVRWQISSGTHAITLCLQGILKPGDKLVAVSGPPYDTLKPVIKDLVERGVTYEEVNLFRRDAVGEGKGAVKGATMVLMQRSSGYSFRRAIPMDSLKGIIQEMRHVAPNAVYFVDNCYGEFAQEKEPPHVGADLIAGSLMKNPGGGIAPTGGYVAGKRELVEKAASRLTAPGLAGSIGPSLGFSRLMFQGFFLAPGMVREALQGAVFAARFFADFGYEVCPAWDEPRGDIVQAINLGSPDRLKRFCRAAQAACPIDSMAVPEAGEMPGYDHEVIMAAGTFVQGATLEFSADAPMRQPFVVYLQGGLAREQAILACLLAAEAGLA